MGNNLKGRECGKGICQRKDGKYSARYRSGTRRSEKHFDTLPKAKNWLADAQYEERHDIVQFNSDMTVDMWFNFWMENLICDLSPNTKRNYRERYKINIQPILGPMRMVDVEPMHCKAVLYRMETEYAGSTIRQAYIAMGTMFKAAVMNGIIGKHPMNGVRYTESVRAVDDIKYLTKDEQEQFLAAAKRSHNYRQYVLLLETGLRTGELIGLTWDSIDWKKRTLIVNQTLEFRYKQKYWCAGPPKTESSYRTIPLTDRAFQVLQECYNEKDTRKQSETLSQVLEYMDRRTGQTGCLVMRDLVFVNWRTGEPAKNSSYDTRIFTSCVMRLELSDSVCTHYAIHMPQEQLRVVCSPRYCKNYSAMRVLRQPWIVMSTLPMILCRMQFDSSNSLVPKSADSAKLVRNWCGRAGRKPGNP